MIFNVWLSSFLTVILLFQLVSIPALILKKNDLADVLWGPAFLITAIVAVYFATPEGFSALTIRPILILFFIAIWSTRLFLHVGLRNLSHKAEDVRYNNWRKQWGKHWLWRSYLQVFVLQPLILYVFLLPALLSIISAEKELIWANWLGALIFIIGFLFESIADEQLRRFKSQSQNKGRLMTTGLWSWSRHPNYFGEVLQWWGIWLLVIDLPFGWATLVSPIGVTYLILKVSGVSMLEDLMKNRVGFREYAAKTSIFIPRPPRATAKN